MKLFAGEVKRYLHPVKHDDHLVNEPLNDGLDGLKLTLFKGGFCGLERRAQTGFVNGVSSTSISQRLSFASK